jgi:hypothetical protein
MRKKNQQKGRIELGTFQSLTKEKEIETEMRTKKILCLKYGDL